MDESNAMGAESRSRAEQLLNADTVRDGTAGSKLIAHLMGVADEREHLVSRLDGLEEAFVKLAAHERVALEKQLRVAMGPDGKRFLKAALAECAGGLLCELLKLILL